MYNLGTGNGCSVLEMVEAMKKASQRASRTKSPRAATSAGSADPKLAREELKWSAKRGLDEMCEDVWRWQSNNPNGYK